MSGPKIELRAVTGTIHLARCGDRDVGTIVEVAAQAPAPFLWTAYGDDLGLRHGSARGRTLDEAFRDLCAARRALEEIAAEQKAGG